MRRHRPNRLVIYLVGGNLGVHEVDPHGALAVAGFYAPEVEGVLAVAERRTINEEWASAQAVIFHEYTHHFVHQYYPGVYPAWYQEGFAEYCSTAKFKGDIVTLGEPLPERMLPLFHQPWMPIADVIAPPPYRTSVTSGPMFYPEAWLATHYLLRDDDRRQRLIDYLLALRTGANPRTAFQAGFGMDFPTFQRALVSYLNGKSFSHYSQIHLATPFPVAQITVSQLPPSADKLLLLRARLIVRHGHPTPAEAFAGQPGSHCGLAAFPDDALALRTLARAEVFFGDPDKADAPLDRLLAAHPDDVEAVYLKGMRYQRAFLWGHANTPQLLDKARTYLQKARRLDPDFYPAAFQLAANLTLTGGWPTEEGDRQRPGGASRLAPQVDEITYGAALALLRAKRPRGGQAPARDGGLRSASDATQRGGPHDAGSGERGCGGRRPGRRARRTALCRALSPSDKLGDDGVRRAMALPTPPRPRKEPKVTEQLGRTRTDDYAWMKDDDWQAVLHDPSKVKAEVREHLVAENAYTQAMLAGTEPLQAELFAEMKGRIKEDDASVPSPDGAFEYFSRYKTGAQHPQHVRQPRAR